MNLTSELILSCYPSRSSSAKKQVHSGHKLDWNHIPGWEGEEAAGAVLSRSHWSQQQQVELFSPMLWNQKFLEVFLMWGTVLSLKGWSSSWAGCVSADTERGLYAERVQSWGHGRADYHVPRWSDWAIPVCCGTEGRKRPRSEPSLFSHTSPRVLLVSSECWLILWLSLLSDDPTLLNFKKGDLIIIIKDNELLEGRGWVKGENDSTRKRGAVPVEAILILPTLTKPTNEVMVRLGQPNRKEIKLFFVFSHIHRIFFLYVKQTEG